MESTPSSPRRFGLVLPNATAFVASLCIMVAELVAGRIVSRHLGQSLYTWTSCIGVFLTGLAIGNYIGGRLADRHAARPALSALFLVTSLCCLFVPLINSTMAGCPWIWERSWPMRIFIHVTSTFILPAGMLGTIGPVVAKMALGEGRATGQTIGLVYAWGAIGSIVGTYLTGFYLIAWMGTTETIVAVAVILACMSLIFGVKYWLPRIWTLFCAIVAASFFVHSGVLDSMAFSLALRPEAAPEQLWEKESQYSYISVSTMNRDANVRSMSMDRMIHSMMNIRNPLDVKYDYTRIYAGVVDKSSTTNQALTALMLGGGGYAFPQYFERVRPNSRIDVVEIDPAVTQAAEDFFGFTSNNQVRVIHADARQFVADQVRQKGSGKGGPVYDYILGDTFNSYAVPYQLTTREFVQQLDTLLSPDGLYVLNCIDVLETGRFLSSIIKTCRAIFSHVYVFTCSETQNGRETFVVVCSEKERGLSDVVDRVREKWPFAGRLWSDKEVDQFAKSSRGIVLTDDHAPVEYMLATTKNLNAGATEREYMIFGDLAAKKGQWNKAIKYARRVLAAQPNNATAHYNLAMALIQSGRREEALIVIQNGRKMDAEFSLLKDLESILLMQMGRVDDVIALWQASLRDGSDVFAAHVNLGTIYLKLNKSDLALNHWEEALRLDPSNAVLHFQTGDVYMSANRHAEAASHYRAAVAAKPDFARAYNNLGVVLVQQGHIAEASKLFAEALRYDPQLTEAQQNLRQWPPAQ